MTTLWQGAEARLMLGQFNGKECLIKERFVKKYRHPDLDKHLTRERMRAESKAISRCRAAGLNVPAVVHMDLDERKIYMEYFSNSITTKAYINDIAADSSADNKRLQQLANEIGTCIGTMHTNNIIHGDLTTSNFLLNSPTTNDGDKKDFTEYQLIVIDFGLSSYSQSAEQKGVDLYVLERALLSTHSSIPQLFELILDAYKQSSNNCQEIIAKFEEVRARGRKRTMVG